MGGDIRLLPLYAVVAWIGKSLSLFITVLFNGSVTNSDNTASNTPKSAEQIGSNAEGRVVSKLQIPPRLSSGKIEENQVKRPIHSQLN
jgi:hypothetical protein